MSMEQNRGSFRKPVQNGEKHGNKPYARPADRNFVPKDRKYGAQNGGQRSFDRTAGAKDGERRNFSRPADAVNGERRNFGSNAVAKDGERRNFSRPADAVNGERRSFGRPAGAVNGEHRSFARPASENRNEQRSFSRPTGERSFSKPMEHKTFGHPAAPARLGPYGRPAPKPKAPDAPMEGLVARRLALKVLRKVTEDGAYASLALDEALRGCGLNDPDRRLVSRLVYDTLDRLIYLDHCLSQVMAKPDTDIKLRNILRLGACQILLEDRIPESAATNTCVELCVELGMEGLKGVCNGILRNLVRQKDTLLMPDPETEPDQAFALRHSLPLWLGQRLRRDWGEEAEKLSAYRQPESFVTIRPNLTRFNDESFDQYLNKKIWGRERSDIPHAWRITGAMDLGSDADFIGGNFSIEGESSMLACLALDVKRGKTVLDCCAAPGGKTCYLAELMDGTGRVQAWDVHEHRVALINSQMRRLGLENIRPIVRDATVYREELEQSMDYVLLDAPCSGLGVLAGKPDIKLRVSEESVEELTALQKKLLDTVCRYVRPGGVMVYSTCSVLKDENEYQIRAFLNGHPEFTLSSLPESIPEVYRNQANVGLQLLPHRDGLEGFYICRLKRKL